MGITVDDLAADPLLKTRVVAGHGGTRRQVAWAHSCELSAPWEWLGEGDLVMTTGFPVPEEAGEQAAFVERMSAEGLAGIAIGENMNAPPLRPAMLEAANRAAFPLLVTAYEVPFVALSQAVAHANQREEQERLSRMVRMYDRVRRAVIEGHDAARLLDDLATELGCDLHVVAHDGTGIFPGPSPLPEAVWSELAAELAARSAGPPAVLRLRRDERAVLAVPIPSMRAALLVVRPRHGEAPSLALLQHVATIVALEVEKLTAEREHRRRTGSELFASILEGRVDAGVTASQLALHGLRPEALVIAALERSGQMRSDMHSRLADRGIPHVLLRRGETLLIALDADGPGVDRLLELAGHDAHVGLSSRPVADHARLPDAVREARMALRAARSASHRVVLYGDNEEPFMPRTLAEATAIADRILGTLVEYDEDHCSDLVKSLDQFLRMNRSWQRAAEVLFVHKQTLVYRMKRVEELTGRRLDDTGDVAELWLALRALELSR